MTKGNKYDVVILGGGAAGLFCAFETAKKGYKVVVLEKSNKVAKDLMSGGGRCNFTNRNVYPHNFYQRTNTFLNQLFQDIHLKTLLLLLRVMTLNMKKGNMDNFFVLIQLKI